MLGIGEGAQPLPSLSCIEDGGVEAEEGVEGESSSRSNPFHEVLSKLGDFDVEQRERLEKAQRFIETEVARFVHIARIEERRDVSVPHRSTGSISNEYETTPSQPPPCPYRSLLIIYPTPPPGRKHVILRTYNMSVLLVSIRRCRSRRGHQMFIRILA